MRVRRSRSASQVAADLELEVAVAVGRDDLLERLRQAVVDARAGRLVGRDDRVDEADRVARLDASAPARGRRGSRRSRSRRGRARPDARAMPGRLLRIAVQKLDAVEAAHARRARRDRAARGRSSRPAAEAELGGRRAIWSAIVVGVEVERASTSGAAAVGVGRDLDRLAQLVDGSARRSAPGSCRTTWRRASRPRSRRPRGRRRGGRARARTPAGRR